MSNSWRQDISNEFLGITKTITGKSPKQLRQKVNDQLHKWKSQEECEKMKLKAEKDTKKSLKEIEDYNNLLVASLSRDLRISWGDMYKDQVFSEPPPILEDIEKTMKVPKEDKFWEFIFSSYRSKRLKLKEEANKQYHNEMIIHRAKENEFYSEQKAYNDEIQQYKNDFEVGKKEAVERYITEVLHKSGYPKKIKKKFEVNYNPESEIVIVDYQLPSADKDLPKIIEYKYVQTRKEIVSKEMKKKDFEAFFEEVILQICLRTVYEICQSVYNGKMKIVVFNGWVNGIDSATGKDFTSCIVSLQVTPEQIRDINFARVRPKDCFRNLKGRNAGALYNLAPVQPILKAKMDDERFVESREVLAEVNSIPNLAEMDWEDFEHLIRELFELMFKERGAEVKVTRCSRDWGIDAVIFDPDPIYGGKFIIQAKRWNILTSPSNVRDLYGTIVHEQASRGILVTTSWFGPESYEFANGKQITLINGQELLGLLEKHGYNARISLRKK
jgi:restriction system protein